jgi:hypothetical protein
VNPKLLTTVAALALAGLTAAATVHAAPPRSTHTASSTAGPPDAADGADPPAPDGFVAPVPIVTVSIAYPAALAELAAPPRGRVVAKWVVAITGEPIEIEVLESPDERLSAHVIAELSKLRYEPATFHGEPVEVSLSLSVELAPPEAAGTLEGEAGRPAGDGAAEPTSAGGPTPDDSQVAALEGVLLVAGQRTPLAGATILVVPADADAPLGPRRRGESSRAAARAEAMALAEGGEADAASWRATSDDRGRFELAGLPAGRVHMVIVATGFERFEAVEALTAGEALSLRYFVEPTSTNAYRTVVETDAAREEIGRRTISIAEVNALPGNSGDALKSITALPGVARPPYGVGLLVIRGAAPFDSAVYVGEHGIPLLFHFGALATLINSDALAGVEFVPSNYDVRWGNAIGGVVSVTPRKGRRDGWHGVADVDLFDTGALVEGPVGKGSIILTLRRSWIDAILAPVAGDSLGLTRAPRYWDYAAFFDHPVGKHGSVTVRWFGGDDRFALVGQSPNDAAPSQANGSSTTTWVHRGDVVARAQRHGWSFLISPSFRAEFGGGQTGRDFQFDVARNVGSFRAQIDGPLSRRASIQLGTEGFVMGYQIDAQASPLADTTLTSPDALLNPGTSAGDDQVVERLRATSATIGVYASATLGVGTRVRVTPGVRVMTWGYPMFETRVDPRVRIAIDVARRTQLRGGLGLFSQTPLFQDLTRAFGNPSLAPLRAHHASLELEQGLPGEASLVVSGFFNSMWDLPTRSSAGTLEVTPGAGGATSAVVAERLVSEGLGRAYGAEVLLKKPLTRAFTGWIGYTLMRSERRGIDGGDAGRWVAFDYDQRHILNALAAVALPRRWTLGARFRLATGNPTTPIVGAFFDADTGGYVGVEGPRNGERLPAFHQLDLRLSKRWIWRRSSLEGYLELQNAYNRANVEFFQYAFDYRTRAAVQGLPILPSFGVRVEW